MSGNSPRADTQTHRFMEFIHFMPHSAEKKASQTQGIHNHQMLEHAEIHSRKKGKERKKVVGRSGYSAQIAASIFICPHPLKKYNKEFQSATECGDCSSSNIGFE